MTAFTARAVCSRAVSIRVRRSTSSRSATLAGWVGAVRPGGGPLAGFLALGVVGFRTVRDYRASSRQPTAVGSGDLSGARVNIPGPPGYDENPKSVTLSKFRVFLRQMGAMRSQSQDNIQ